MLRGKIKLHEMAETRCFFICSKPGLFTYCPVLYPMDIHSSVRICNLGCLLGLSDSVGLECKNLGYLPTYLWKCLDWEAVVERRGI